MLTIDEYTYLLFYLYLHAIILQMYLQPVDYRITLQNVNVIEYSEERYAFMKNPYAYKRNYKR